MDDEEEEAPQDDLTADDFFATASDTHTPSKKHKGEAQGGVDGAPRSEKRRRAAEHDGTGLATEPKVSRVAAKKQPKGGAEAPICGSTKKRRASTDSET